MVKDCLRGLGEKAGVSELLGYYKNRNFAITLVACGSEVLAEYVAGAEEAQYAYRATNF